jgi:hypothetical protein
VERWWKDGVNPAIQQFSITFHLHRLKEDPSALGECQRSKFQRKIADLQD